MDTSLFETPDLVDLGLTLLFGLPPAVVYARNRLRADTSAGTMMAVYNHLTSEQRSLTRAIVAYADAPESARQFVHDSDLFQRLIDHIAKAPGLRRSAEDRLAEAVATALQRAADAFALYRYACAVSAARLGYLVLLDNVMCLLQRGVQLYLWFGLAGNAALKVTRFRRRLVAAAGEVEVVLMELYERRELDTVEGKKRLQRILIAQYAPRRLSLYAGPTRRELVVIASRAAEGMLGELREMARREQVGGSPLPRALVGDAALRSGHDQALDSLERFLSPAA